MSTIKKRDPNLVFVGMPKKDDNIPDCTRALWASVETGKKLGRFTFQSATCTGFSSNKNRNILTALALDSDAGVMLQLDADMNLGEDQLLSILNRNEKIVGGLYPKKRISLRQDWVANFAVGSSMRPDGLWQCVDIGAGALRVDLDVVEAMIEKFPETAYFCEDEPWRNVVMHDLWSAGVINEDWRKDGKPYARYLTDDFFFCWRARQCGFPIWADTRAQCGHIGMVDYLQLLSVFEDLTGTVKTATEPEEGIRGLIPPARPVEPQGT